MDKAILGKCRLGYFRLGVKRDDFDRILTRKKAVSTPHKVCVDRGTVKVDVGVYRVDEFIQFFEKLKNSMER